MKYILLVHIVFMMFSFRAQSIQITAQYVFGGNSNDVATEGIRTGNKTILGGTSDSGMSGDKTTTNYGYTDMWILSLDENNLIEWQNSFGGDGYDQLGTIFETSDGGYLILGSSTSIVSGNKTAAKIGGNDFWVIKVDGSGNEVWQRTYGGTGDDSFGEAKKLADGSIVLVGSSDSPISGDKTSSSYGGSDIWMINIDTDGTVLWDKTIGGSAGDGGLSVLIDNSDNIYVSGLSTSPISGLKTEPNIGSRDVWLLKLKNDGSLIWDRTIGGDQFELGGRLVVQDNCIFLATSSASGISGTKTDISRGSRDLWITKLDTSGNILMDKTFGGSDLEQLGDMLLTTEGELFLGGDTDSPISGEVEVATIDNSRDFWVLVLDTSDLSIQSQFVYGGNGFEHLPHFLETANNSILLFGGSSSGISGNKTEQNKGGNDFWLLELSTELGLQDEGEINQLAIYPNPASRTFSISNLNPDNDYNLLILNTMGQKVLESNVNASNNSVNIELLASGVYTIQLFDEELKYISKFVVK